MMMNHDQLTINDRPVEVPEGTTVLEAAHKLGINIPTLCHYERHQALWRLPPLPGGGDRGPRTQLTTACTYPVAEGLKVHTDTEEVLEGRRLVMDLLLSRCPEVPALQEMARQMGVMEPSFPPGDERLHPVRQVRPGLP